MAKYDNAEDEKIKNSAKELANEINIGKQYLFLIGNGTSEEEFKSEAATSKEDYSSTIDAYNNLEARADKDNDVYAAMGLYNLAMTNGVKSDGKFWSRNSFEKVQEYLKNYQDGTIEDDYLKNLAFGILDKGSEINDERLIEQLKSCGMEI